MKTIVYYCTQCNVPLLKTDCDRCGQRGIEISRDLRPVFKEEINLLEKISGVKFNFKVQSPFLWANIRNFIVNGKTFFKVIGGGMNTPPKIEILDCTLNDYVLEEEEAISRLREANKVQLSKITEQSKNFIREVSEKYNDRTFLVSFSGGKDSTVVSDLVIKALGTKKIWHAFGDTTLEFPTTYEYVNRYKDINDVPFIPQILVKANGDFYNLCEELGVPSRIQRWCCSIFKTGTLGKAINWLSKDVGKGTLTFDGIRSSESARREDYSQVTEENKIGKQVLASPIKEWLDVDVWTYILSNNLIFNEAYRYGYTRVGCIPCPFNSPWSEMMTSFVFPEEAKRWHSTLKEYAQKIGRPDTEEYIISGGWKTRAGGLGLNKRRVYIEKHICDKDENFITYEISKDLDMQIIEYMKPLGDIKSIYDNGIMVRFDLYAHKTSKKLAYIECVRVRNQLRVRPYIEQNKEYFIDYFMKLLKLRMALVSKNDEYDKKKIIDPVQYFFTRLDRQIRKYQSCQSSCSACRTVCPFKAISGNVPLPENLQDKLDSIPLYIIDDKKCTRCMTCVDYFKNGCIASSSLHISSSRRRENGG